MAHYAFLDLKNIVTEVIVGKDETDTSQDWEAVYGSYRNQTCKRTSYNTSGGVHLGGGTAFRKNYAGKGYSYDSTRDAFIPPKPYASWTLNETTCLWEAPVAYPTTTEDSDNNPIFYEWNEDNQTWDLTS